METRLDYGLDGPGVVLAFGYDGIAVTTPNAPLPANVSPITDDLRPTRFTFSFSECGASCEAANKLTWRWDWTECAKQ